MTIAALAKKARTMIARIGGKRGSPGLEPITPWLTPAVVLTPDEIMAAVEAERSNPKRQAELEHYRNLFQDGSLR